MIAKLLLIAGAALHIQLPTGSERVMVRLLTAWAQNASMVSATGTTVDLFLVDSLDELLDSAGRAPEKAAATLQSASKLEALSDRIVSGKVQAFMQAGFDPCSGAERWLRRYEDGSHALLHGERPVAIHLQGLSLRGVQLTAEMTETDVVSVLGRPSRRQAGLLVYESNALNPEASEVDQVHFTVIVQLGEGRVLRAVLFRQFDDC